MRAPLAVALAWLVLASCTRQATPAGEAKVMIFCASWAVQCNLLDEALAKDPLKSDLAGADVQRVDCTDDDAPGIASAEKERNVQGVPTVIVLDAAGHEVGRITSPTPQDLSRLHALIAAAQKTR
jgi:thiol:disulfide interchange protein